MQVQTFRKVSGYSYASTMCIGNLRSGTAALSVYFREHKKDQLRQSLYYFGIILFFAIGAGIGGNLSAHYGLHTIWISDGLLCVSFVLMFIERLG
jgi:predicted membrane protein